MDQQAYESAKAAYQKGDWARAVSELSSAEAAGELTGAAYHLRGNALMKLGLYSDAADAYAQALSDIAYGKVGALSCNQGRALLAAGRVDEAIVALTNAARDPEYPTPYKVFMSLGNAYLKRGDLREAGISFRNAAIDENNPDPSGALVKLGRCFNKLGRPVDAIEAFRTALDFSTPAESQNKIFAELGCAYVAANRMSEAVDAFSHATADGGYQLNSEERTALDAANKAVAALTRGPSETDAFLQAAGYTGTGSYDPLDPLGRSGEMMPSPEDTGFFEVTEADLIQAEKANRKMRRKHGHGCLKTLLALLILLALLAGAAFFAYSRGFGWPTQEATITGMFDAAESGDISAYLSSAVSEEGAAEILSILPSGATVTIDGMDQSMNQSLVRATVSMPQGASQPYEILLAREGLGWKVMDVNLVFESQGDSGVAVITGEVEGEAIDESSDETPAETVEADEDAQESTDETPAEQPSDDGGEG